MWSPSKSERGEGTAIVLWPLAIVGVIAVVGLTMLGVQARETKKVSVPNADLPPAHEIVAADLETRTVDADTVSDSDQTEMDELVGHVTTTTIAKGEPVPKDGVTAAKPEEYDDLVPVAFHIDSATAGKVESGDWVTLSFAPTVDSSSVEPLSAAAVLLSAEELESGETDYVVALSEADRTAMLGVLARARLLVTPRP